MVKILNAENILVSTDSKLIKPEMKGLKVPFIRPKICDDYTGNVPVVTHALDGKEHKKVDYVLTVYPIKVLLVKKIFTSNDKAKNYKSCDTVMSATNFSFLYSEQAKEIPYMQS